ncbi:MAG: M18 family aminopeptidase [Aerococcus sp.]|nr:M18 family aminopeptidase [Aerococcus sp.]
MVEKATEQLIQFIQQSPTAFHAVDQVKKRLKEANFQELFEDERWQIQPGGKYFVTRNDSSLIAVKVGEEIETPSLQMVASHSDSPTFRLKNNQIIPDDHYLRINTESYGGAIISSWLDRPLSIAGRLLVKTKQGIESRLVNIDRDLLAIPNVAIHLLRDQANGHNYQPHIDLIPLLGLHGENDAQRLRGLLAHEAGIAAEQILSSDLMLYNRTPATIWGIDREFFSSRQLDNLMSAYTTFAGFLQGYNPHNVNVYLLFDNEEVGSGTKQGGLSTFAPDVLKRLVAALGGTPEDYFRALANGFMISADNAHAVHPNHPELHDATDRAYLNQGIVIKTNAAQHYTSDAQSIAVFKWLCDTANIPLQYFSNRADKRGGSTLGNLMLRQASIDTVDIGLPQLAMHSAYETAGVKDPAYMVRAIKNFFDYHIEKKQGTHYHLAK